MSKPNNYNKRVWDDMKKAMANRRKGRAVGTKAEESDLTITVQRLSENVEGKCQKYQRMCLLTMVKINGDVILDSIRDACIKGFDIPAEKYSSDIMAGKRGPSLSDISQIKNINFFISVFITKRLEADTDDISSCRPTSSRRSANNMPSTSSSRDIDQIGDHNSNRRSACPDSTVLYSIPAESHSHSSKSDGPSQYQVSVSLSSMLKLGKLIKPE
ncbi:hypothetical protein SNE40_002772 [Patella caerulea]|uniref:Uncharacterized protein n=1 Tax=Patella caerulea TaxID=87958 RepID=A0AAN8K976_PATCE